MFRIFRKMRIKRTKVQHKQLGLRLDRPVEGGMTKCRNAEILRGQLCLRPPRHLVSTGGDYGLCRTATYYHAVNGNRYIVADFTGDETMTTYMFQVEADGRELTEIAATTVAGLTGVSFSENDSLPTYTSGRGGMFRCDGIENKIIESPTLVHGCGVEPPDTEVNVAITNVAVPTLPDITLSVTAEPNAQGVELAPGTYKFLFRIVREIDGTLYKSNWSDAVPVDVPDVDGYRNIGLHFSAFPKNKEIYHSYEFARTLCDGNEFFRMWQDTTVGIFQIGIPVDELDADITGNNSAEPGGGASFLSYTKMVVYTTFVKKYVDGTEVESYPSPGRVFDLTGFTENFKITNIPVSTDPEVGFVRLYRPVYGGDPNQSYRAGEVSNGTLTATLEKTDEILAVENNQLNFDLIKPPVARYVLQAGSHMVYLNLPEVPGGKSLFMFSSPEQHEGVYAKETRYFDTSDGQPIMGGAVLGDHLVVFKSSKCQLFSLGEFWPGTILNYGLVSASTIQPYRNGIVFLSREGVIMLTANLEEIRLSQDKIQVRIIQDYMDNGAVFQSALYPEKDQYHIIAYFNGASGIEDHVYLVCSLRIGEWVDFLYEDAGSPVYDMALCNAADESGRQVVVTIGNGLSQNEGDTIDWDIVVPDSDEGDTVAPHSTWDSCIFVDGATTAVYFLANDEMSLPSLFRSTSNDLRAWSEASPCGTPTTAVTLTNITRIDESTMYFVGIDAANLQRVYSYNIPTSSWAEIGLIDAAVIDSEARIVATPGSTSHAFLLFSEPNPAVPIYDEATELSNGYSVGQVVFDEGYRRVRRYLGNTTSTSHEEPTNGHGVQWAYLYPDCLNGPETPSYYIFDSSGLLTDGAEIHCYVIPWGFGGLCSGIRHDVPYYARLVAGTSRIFQIFTEPTGGDPVRVAMHYTMHSFLEDGFAVWGVPNSILWLPIGEEFEQEPVQRTFHEWEYIERTPYVRPILRKISGDAILPAYEFEYGDRLFPESLAYSEADRHLYGLRFPANQEEFVVFRKDVRNDNSIEECIKYCVQYDHEQSKLIPETFRIFPSPIGLWVYNGYNLKLFDEESGWTRKRITDDFQAKWIGMNEQGYFWTYTDEPVTTIQLITFEPKVFAVADIPSLPGGLKGFDVHPSEFFLTACHSVREAPDQGGTTLYYIRKFGDEISSSVVIGNPPTPGELTFYGPVMEITSCYFGEQQGHRFRVHGGSVEVTSNVLSGAEVSLETNIDLKRRGAAAKRTTVLSRGLMPVENREPGTIQELHLYARQCSKARWSLRAGALIDSPANIKISPPTWISQVVGEVEDNE